MTSDQPIVRRTASIVSTVSTVERISVSAVRLLASAVSRGNPTVM